MLNIKALAVKNYGPFTKQTVFEFKSGISVIYGLNQTSGVNSKNSNWVGKSLFFNSLSELLYDEPIVGQKSDKVKSGSRSVILKDKKHELQITKISGKREQIKIKYDGSEIEHLTKTKALDYIKDKWKLDKTEFESFIHLDSRIPHPLVMGSSTERKHFFDSFFKLSVIDDERRIYISELRKLQSVRVAFDELKIVYKSQKRLVINDSELDTLKSKLKRLKAKRDSLNSKIEEAKEYQRLKAIHDSVGKVNINIAEIDSSISELKTKIKSLSAQLDLAIDYEQYKKEKARYTKIVSSLSDFAKSKDREKLKKGANLYSEYKAELRLRTSQLDEIEEPEIAKKPNGERLYISELLAVRSNLQHQISHSEKFKTGICPTCGQKVKHQNLQELKSKLSDTELQIKLAKQWELYDSYVKEYEKYSQTTKSLKSQIEELTAKCNKFKPYADAYSEVQSVPSNPEKVEKPSSSREELESAIDSCKSKLHSLLVVQPYVDDLIKFENWNGITDFDYSKSSVIAESIAKIEAKLSNDESARLQLQKTKSRLLELKSKLKDEPLLKSLIEIFSDKVIKKTMVTQISAKLCELLNHYSSLVFDQDYKFNLIWDTQLQLICTRTVGKQQLTSDVRKLSGAESKLFTIILVLSLLSFIDPLKRPKTIILDEPTANLSNETTQAFIKLLQLLKQVVPSIVVITPRDDVYPDSRCYTVVRTKEGSTIKEGLPELVRHA